MSHGIAIVACATFVILAAYWARRYWIETRHRKAAPEPTPQYRLHIAPYRGQLGGRLWRYEVTRNGVPIVSRLAPSLLSARAQGERLLCWCADWWDRP